MSILQLSKSPSDIKTKVIVKVVVIQEHIQMSPEAMLQFAPPLNSSVQIDHMTFKDVDI